MFLKYFVAQGTDKVLRGSTAQPKINRVNNKRTFRTKSSMRDPVLFETGHTVGRGSVRN